MRPPASCANNWRLETRKCDSRKQGHQLFKVDYSVVNQINEISIIKMLILYNYYNVDVDNEDFLSYDFNSIKIGKQYLSRIKAKLCSTGSGKWRAERGRRWYLG